MVFQRLISSLFYLHPVLYSFAQGFILLCRTYIPNENEASGMRNKMSLCRCQCIDTATLSVFSLSDSTSTLLQFLVVASACWLEQVWLDKIRKTGGTGEVCKSVSTYDLR